MHTSGESSIGSNVPAFLAKLWRLTNDSETNDLIYWSNDGRSFIIQNQARFAKELLPLNYKHNNMASFIRQLNMYGFHKITSIDNGGLKFDKDEMEFSHPCFQRGHPYLLEHIKRKIAHPKGAQDEKNLVRVEAVSKMLNEVKTMRGRQDVLDSRFSSMKQENEALWREIAILRQKHLKQQQIVNKLIQFLVTMVQPSRSGLNGMGGGGSGKRRFHLMINDAPRSSKCNRVASPIIHELEEELLEDMANTADETAIVTDIPNIASPQDQDEDSQQLQSASDPSGRSGGRKSVDYLVDHIDDLEPNETLVSQFPDKDTDDILHTPLVTKLGGEIERDTPSRKRVYESEEDEDSLTSTFFVKEKRDVDQQSAKKRHTTNYNQVSLLKDNKSKLTGDKKQQKVVYVKKEKDFNSGTLSFNVSSASGEKSYLNKEDLFSEQVPAELFDNEDMLSKEKVSPIINEDIDINEGRFNFNPSFASTSYNNGNNIVKLADGTNMQVAKFNGKSNTNDILKINCANTLDSHLSDVQMDLENLKDILKGDSYQFDPSALLNLFVNEEISPYEISQDPAGDVAINSLQAPADGNTDGTVALTEFQPVVDLSELLDITTPNECTENNDVVLNNCT